MILYKFFFFFVVRSNNWTYSKKGVSSSSAATADDLLSIFCRDGEDKILTKLWKRATLKFVISANASYELFEEATAELVGHMYEQHRKSWFHFWPVQTTDVSLSLFNSTCVGIATREPYAVSVDQKAIYSGYLVCTFLAVLFFYSAKRLSKNIAFYYGTGVTIGILASILLLFFVLSRMIPGKKAGVVVMATGVSTFVGIIQYIWRTQVLTFLEQHYDIVLAYLVLSGLLSFTLLYWYGPPSNPRSLDIVQWMIQLVALSMLYYSIQVRQVAVVAMLLLVLIYNFPWSIFRRITFIWRVRFPPKMRLLTTAEYEQQADEFTRKALEELRGYCKSPKCDAWKTISKLRTPTRFADFVEGSFHLQDDELLSYDSGDSAMITPVTSDDDDSDVEIDFRLSTR